MTTFAFMPGTIGSNYQRVQQNKRVKGSVKVNVYQSSEIGKPNEQIPISEDPFSARSGVGPRNGGREDYDYEYDYDYENDTDTGNARACSLACSGLRRSFGVRREKRLLAGAE
jgi:hypothetical protein